MPELQDKHDKQIESAIKKLNKTMSEIRKYIPEASFYIENGNNINVLSGTSHNGVGDANYDNVLECYELKHSECGGW